MKKEEEAEKTNGGSRSAGVWVWLAEDAAAKMLSLCLSLLQLLKPAACICSHQGYVLLSVSLPIRKKEEHFSSYESYV